MAVLYAELASSWTRLTDNLRTGKASLEVNHARGGVCHDKRDIAVDMLGGNVLTMLFDAKGKVRTPGLLRRRQWLFYAIP